MSNAICAGEAVGAAFYRWRDPVDMNEPIATIQARFVADAKDGCFRTTNAIG